MKYCTLTIILLVAVLGVLLYTRNRPFEMCCGGRERLEPSKKVEKCCGRRESFCPQGCSPFQYPDMYSPLASCSDPFSWGDYFTTGRCGKKVERPVLRSS